MNKGTIIANALASAPDITAITGSRIYPVVLQQADEMPCLAWYITSADPANSNDNPPSLTRYNFSIQVVARSYREVDELAAIVRDVLEIYQDDIVNKIWFQSEADDYQPELECFVRIIDFQIRVKK
jgi:hypothetical protein